MYPKSPRQTPLISQFQKSQITRSTFKRNKIYININKMQNDQKQLQVKRRSPIFLNSSPKSQRVSSNIEKNFKYSVQELNSKLGQSMQKFKDRIGSKSELQKYAQQQEYNAKIHRYQDDELDNPESSMENQNMKKIYEQENNSKYSSQKDKTVNTSHNKNQFLLRSSLSKRSNNYSFSQFSRFQKQLNESQKIASFYSKKVKNITPIDKQISRQYLHRYKVTKHDTPDQRNFNNFKIEKHDLSKTQDFKKSLPREINFVHEHINDINYKNVEKAYQYFNFPTENMKVRFSYNLQNSQAGRKFFVAQDPNSVAKTVLQPTKILKSFTQASNFKPNKIDPFYKTTGRDIPHQLDQRFYSPNKNFYRNKQGQLQRQPVDYSVKKLYDDLVHKQKQQQNKKKNPQFTRNQICDIRYFQEMIKKQNKMKESNRIRHKNNSLAVANPSILQNESVAGSVVNVNKQV